MIVVTGSAGLIGFTFASDWFGSCDEPVLSLDALS
ncbi:MAG: hypothetical protein FD164_5 [Nitrospirae bacterium]|nr:MAG: hypothetical protein FD164_5 [Nitrospirota bacterium]